MRRYFILSSILPLTAQLLPALRLRRPGAPDEGRRRRVTRNRHHPEDAGDTQDGTLTAWCAQHDERTLAPAWGRAYEPPSLSGSESVGIVRFLMEIAEPTPEIVAAIEGAAAWLKAVAIPGLRYETFTSPDGQRDRRVVSDPSARLLWARFYELGSNRPIFLGRDSVVRSALSEIERERRAGYAYYGTWPATLLDSEFGRWRQRNSR